MSALRRVVVLTPLRCSAQKSQFYIWTGYIHVTEEGVMISVCPLIIMAGGETTDMGHSEVL